MPRSARSTQPDPQDQSDGWYSLHGRPAQLAIAAVLLLALLLVVWVVLLPVL